MRFVLDRLYAAAAWLAAAFLVGLLAMVLLGIAGRQLHFFVPGTDAYAGYLMAGAGFLALAHTLKRGEHIRVTLLVGRARGGLRHALELVSLAVTSALAVIFAFYAARLTQQSYAFNDISTGNDATPLWIPQLTITAGAALFAVAAIDELWLEFRHRRSLQTAGEAPIEAARSE